MALALDGSNVHGANSTGDSTLTITTTSSPDVIVVLLSYGGTSVDAGSTITGGGLSWTKRKSIANATGAVVEEWYAIANTTLSAVAITTHLSSTQFWDAVVFGISGADTASPFDSNASIPASATGSSTSPQATISTSNANDFIFILGGDNGGSLESARTIGGSAANLIQHANDFQDTYSAYRIVSATQSSIVASFTITSAAWAFIADAVKQAGAALITSPYIYKPSRVFSPISVSRVAPQPPQNIQRKTLSEIVTSSDPVLSKAKWPTITAVIAGSVLWVAQKFMWPQPQLAQYAFWKNALSFVKSLTESITLTDTAPVTSKFPTISAWISRHADSVIRPVVGVAPLPQLIRKLGNSFFQTLTEALILTDMPTFVNDVNGHPPLFYVPITLTNGQGVGTGTNFQALIDVNSNAYNAYEATDLKNINFQDGTGAILKSWLESGETNSSTSTKYWVLLPNGIGASSTVTVYMVLYGTALLSKDNSVTGAEPNYTGTYGQYDSGANLFDFYDNFAGTSLSGAWTAFSGGVATVNNGCTISGTTTNVWGGFKNSFSVATSKVIDTLTKVNGNGYDSISIDTSFGYQTRPAESAFRIEVPATGFSTNLGSGGTSVQNTLYVVTGYNINPAVLLVNYNNTVTASTQAAFAGGFAIESFNVPTSPSGFFQWVRSRAYPPGGVMPTSSFGGVKSAISSIVFNLRSVITANIASSINFVQQRFYHPQPAIPAFMKVVMSFYQLLSETMTFTDTLSKKTTKVLPEIVSLLDSILSNLRPVIAANIASSIMRTTPYVTQMKRLKEYVLLLSLETIYPVMLYGVSILKTAPYATQVKQLKQYLLLLSLETIYPTMLYGVSQIVKQVQSVKIVPQLIIRLGNLFTQALTETVTATDTLVKKATKVLKENQTQLDVLKKTAHKVLNEIQTQLDTLTSGKFPTATAVFASFLARGKIPEWHGRVQYSFIRLLTGFFQKNLTEAITSSDAFVKKTGKVLTEATVLTDTLKKKLIRTLTESITYIDTKTAKKVALKVLSELITSTDTLLKKPIKRLTETITDADTLKRTTHKLLTATLTLSDSLTRKTKRIMTEVITGTDTLIRKPIKRLLETVTDTDTLKKKLVKTLAELITLTDTKTVKKVALKVLTEVITGTDILAKKPIKRLVEIVTGADTLRRATRKFLTEALILGDSLKKKTKRTISETLVLGDTVVSSIVALHKAVKKLILKLVKKAFDISSKADAQS